MKNFQNIMNAIFTSIKSNLTAFIIHVRPSLIVALFISGILLWLAIGSQHPLAVDFGAIMMFENADRIVRLLMLYGSHRLINSSIRTHKLLQKLENNIAHPLFVAWSCTWILAAAHVISSVK